MVKVLFLLKRRIDYNASKHNKIGLTTGLYNSANFVNEMLNKSGIESYLEVVEDNNSIDREVTKYKPTHVIIEALWVVPTKFHILTKIHPTVKWIIRIHSEVPFMASEGMSMNWFGDYTTYPNVILAVNSKRMLRELRLFLKIKYSWPSIKINEKVVYLPNYYPNIFKQTKNIDYTNSYIDISCFGAIRPLKNHLLQALVSIEFAESINKKLRFHINAGRIEMKGEPVFHNIKSLFEHLYSSGHQLIIHEWMERDKFIELCSQMDIGLQCSFSETFNIVAADLVSQGIPVITSREISWSAEDFMANPVDSLSILDILRKTYRNPELNVILNKYFLRKYIQESKTIWNDYFKIKETKCIE